MKVAISATLFAAYFICVHSAPAQATGGLFPKFIWSRKGNAVAEIEKRSVELAPNLWQIPEGAGNWERAVVEKREKAQEPPLFVSDPDGGWFNLKKRGDAKVEEIPIFLVGPETDGWAWEKREAAKIEEVPLFKGDGVWIGVEKREKLKVEEIPVFQTLSDWDPYHDGKREEA